MKRITRGLCVVVMTVGASAWADCPLWVNRPDLVPECPTHGLLGDEFPALAHMIAEEPGDPTDPKTFLGGMRVIETVRGLLEDAGERPPMIFLNVDRTLFETVRAAVSRLPGGKALATQLQWISPRYVPPNLWTQDLYQPFNDPATGNVNLRPVEAYTLKHPGVLRAANHMAQACDRIQVGSPLRTFKSSKRSPEYGGNIEFVPGARLCLVGDNTSDSFRNQFCRPEDRVEVSTKWLDVGHVDEYLATHRTPGTRCGVSVLITSFEEAMKALRSSPEAKLLDTALPGEMRLSFDSASLRGFQSRRLDGQLFSGFCWWFRTQSTAAKAHPAHHAVAGSTLRGAPLACTEATVGDFLRWLDQPRNATMAFNTKLQGVFDETATKVAARIRERLGSACPVQIVKLPGIFSPPDADRDDVGVESIAMFPSPTNSVHTERRLLVTDPQNQPLRDATQRALRRAGFGSSFVTAFDTLHQKSGGIHCATQTMRICRGNGVPEKPLPAPGAPGSVAEVPGHLEPEDVARVEHALSGVPAASVVALERLAKSLSESPRGTAARERVLAVVERFLAKTRSNAEIHAVATLLDQMPEGRAMLRAWAEGNDPQRRGAALALRLQSTPDGDSRREAMLALLQANPDETLVEAISGDQRLLTALEESDLRAMLRSPSALVRLMAFDGLGSRHGNPDRITITECERLANDPSPRVRLAVASRLLHAGSPDSAWPIVERMLADVDSRVRQQAFGTAFGRWHDRGRQILERLRAVGPDALTGLLEDRFRQAFSPGLTGLLNAVGSYGDPAERRAAAAAVRFGGENLSMVYLGGNPFTRSILVDNAGGHHHELFQLALEDEDLEVRARALRRLATFPEADRKKIAARRNK